MARPLLPFAVAYQLFFCPQAPCPCLRSSGWKRRKGNEKAHRASRLTPFEPFLFEKMQVLTSITVVFYHPEKGKKGREK